LFVHAHSRLSDIIDAIRDQSRHRMRTGMFGESPRSLASVFLLPFAQLMLRVGPGSCLASLRAA
jgi:hypothetical protein